MPRWQRARRAFAAVALWALLAPPLRALQPGRGAGVREPQAGQGTGRPPGSARGNWKGPALRGPHLGNWLENHQGEPLEQQQNALRQEPGFSHLPEAQQQRLLNRLQQLDAMPPDRRARTIGRIENMERLSPERREQIRQSAQELGAMDPGRRQQVRAAFRVLRDMPPAERDRILASPAYRSMYSDHERQILGNLLSVEPYQP